jgi:hypothetical protein
MLNIPLPSDSVSGGVWAWTRKDSDFYKKNKRTAATTRARRFEEEGTVKREKVEATFAVSREEFGLLRFHGLHIRLRPIEHVATKMRRKS